MSQFLEQLTVAHNDNPEWLQKFNAAGAAILRNANWPNRKTENWKYTSLRPLEQTDFLRNRGSAGTELVALRECFDIPGLDAYRLVFVNGCFSSELSDVNDLQDGVDLVCFADASEQQRAVAQEFLSGVVEADRHLFAAVNQQLLDDGVLLHLKKNVQLKKPVQIVWLSTTQDLPFHIPQRLLLVAESQSSAVLVEQFVSTEEVQNSFTHGITELCLADGARCEHYRIHLEEQNALHVGGVHASLAANSYLESFHLGLGSPLKRIDIVVNHNGPGAECCLNGVYLPQENQQIDYHTCIEHRVPHCTTQEVFRGIIADSAKAVFNGRIHIHPQAQKTLAQLNNKNLLLSDRAEIDTKPELEIYADDVQCAHGATVARLDDNALHYFRMRGISQKEAEVMLSYGFINELIEQLKQPALVNYLRPVLTRWFGREADLARHLASDVEGDLR